MKKMTPILAVILALILAVTAVAAYSLLQARMTLFKGHIEMPNAQPGDPKLVLEVDGESIGEVGDVSGDSVTFPVLTNVVGTTSVDAPTEWVDENGNVPVVAPKFVLTADGGDIENVTYKVVASGDTAASAAMEFGITIVYYDDAKGVRTTKTEFANFGVGGEDFATTEPIPLGDANVAEGEKVEIYISAWVDAEVYEKLGVGSTGDFTIDVIFAAGDELP